MQGHMINKHVNLVFNPMFSVPNPTETCQRFRFMYPFTCMAAGMCGSGKTVWNKSLLQQAQEVISSHPERIVWCYSQWQRTYLELMATVPSIEFVKGNPSDLENDSFLDINKRNMMVIDNQMEYERGDKRMVNLFTRGSHH